MADIPLETQEMIKQFNADERARAEEKAARRALSTRPERFTAPKRQMTAREIESRAKGLGYKVEGGNGKHGKHIVAPDGSQVSLPDHPGNLATGTCLAIDQFLKTHREQRKQ